MADEMVRRVSHAITEHCWRHLSYVPRITSAEFLKIARVAIEAMRDPTPEMEWAGRDTDAGARSVWHDMIDEVLEEE